MLPPLDVVPLLSNAFKYSSATDLRCSSVIVWRVMAMRSSPGCGHASAKAQHAGTVNMPTMRGGTTASRCANMRADEQFDYKWDVNRLIERELIELPNTGGITEYMKIIALAETHYIGLIPHSAGPIAEAGPDASYMQW